MKARAVAVRPFHLGKVLRRVERRDESEHSTKVKRQYSDDLSREFSAEVESNLRTHFPNTYSGGGVGTRAASAQGVKSIDVAFTIEGLFLGLGVSIKAVGLPEGSRGYGHNFKRLTEEWTTETILYHRYMPVSIIVGILFLPSHAQRDRPRASSLNHAVEKFRGFQGRTSIRDDFELLEKIYVGLYEDDGEVRFVDVARHLKPLEIPSGTKVLTFEQVKDDLVRLFRQRNPKLRVKACPKSRTAAPSRQLRQRSTKRSQTTEIVGLALPHDQHAVPLLPERGLHPCVARHIRIELLHPELAISRRRRGPFARGMAVPEASVNEDGPSSTAVRDVRRAWEVAIVNAKASPEGMQKFADGQLGGGAVLADTAEPRRGLGVDDEIMTGRYCRST